MPPHTAGSCAITRLLLLSTLCGFVLVPLHADDWLHYRGPALNGVSAEKLPTIPKAGPKQIWKAALGTGTSGVTVAGGKVYSMGNRGDKDVVYCLEAATGREIWKHSYPLALDKRMFEGGPAATPTLDSNRVYTVSHQGDLWCLDAESGKKIWYKHYQNDFRGRRPEWGFAGSPVVEGNLLICDVGARNASTVALDKGTGAIVWKSGDDSAGYAAPVVATMQGQRTVIVFKGNQLVGLDVRDGKELWRAPWKTSYDVNAATPLVIGDRIFISSGYGSGCALFEVSGRRARDVWRNKNLKAHINSPTIVAGHIYGVDDQTGGGKLVCLDSKDGDLKWSEKSVSGGALIAADGKLIVISERGELFIGPASPAGFKPDVRVQVLGGRCWIQPTLANGVLYVKNNQGEMAALQMQ